MPAKLFPIAVTMGDPAGIGPEIIVKLWAEGGLPPAFVIGDDAILRREAFLDRAQQRQGTIDRNARKGQDASDHAPVVAVFEP